MIPDPVSASGPDSSPSKGGTYRAVAAGLRHTSPMVDRTVRLSKSELSDAQSAMRDLQVSISALHRAGSGAFSDSEPVVTEVRAACGFAQKINDVMRNDIGQSEKFKRIVTRRLAAGDPDIELIEAFRYVRNMISHRLVAVAPGAGPLIGGIGLGYRTYCQWRELPAAAHRKMRPSTQQLRPLYRSRLVGEDVTQSLMSVARVYAELCPGLVHRNHLGDWTGFPLRTQPGVPSRVHPMEPPLDTYDRLAIARHRRWLHRRRPGGDFRVIAARLDYGDEQSIVGMTFAGSCSFLPFVESPSQVSIDASLGYAYFAPGAIELEPVEYGPYRGGYRINGYEVSVADPFQDLGPRVTSGDDEFDPWPSFQRVAWEGEVRKARFDYLVYRSERLVTMFPDW